MVHGDKSWQGLHPRRVRAQHGCVGEDKTELTFDSGAVIAKVWPAGRHLAGGHSGWRLIEEDVEFLP